MHANTQIVMSDGTTKSIKTIEIEEYIMTDEYEPNKVLINSIGFGYPFTIKNKLSGNEYQVNKNHYLHLYNKTTRNIVDMAAYDFYNLPNKEDYCGIMKGYGHYELDIKKEEYFSDYYILFLENETKLLLKDGTIVNT